MKDLSYERVLESLCPFTQLVHGPWPCMDTAETWAIRSQKLAQDRKITKINDILISIWSIWIWKTPGCALNKRQDDRRFSHGNNCMISFVQLILGAWNECNRLRLLRQYFRILSSNIRKGLKFTIAVSLCLMPIFLSTQFHIRYNLQVRVLNKSSHLHWQKILSLVCVGLWYCWS